jgi:hypothetical protein
MEQNGTAPVRVQYLGPAPLNGDDSYERTVLARQPWAGPRVAYAASPAKAMRYRRYSQLEDRSAATPLARTEAPRPAGAAPAATSAAPSAPAPVSHANRQKPAQPQPAATKQAENVRPPLPKSATASTPRERANPAITASAAAPHRRELASRFAGIYVEAGVFSKPELARQLAQILNEIAPTSVEPVILGAQNAQRLRMGPFKGHDEAEAALARIRAAGLVNARLEAVKGG